MVDWEKELDDFLQTQKVEVDKSRDTEERKRARKFISVDTKLPRYVYEAPEIVRVAVLKENILEVMENISRTHNTVVENLEKSIQGEAKTMLAINSVSAFLCLLGLLAQIKT